tara:strand:- start:6952 stop:7569 length:618 start_codon:yes stop_codon:yes gene_type:complete
MNNKIIHSHQPLFGLVGMNKMKNMQSMTFEIFEADLEVLRIHALLATESGSINGNKLNKFEIEENYIVSQVPKMYEYFIIDDGKFLLDTGGRTYRGNSKKYVFSLNLSTDTAEKYYLLQHRYSRDWVLNALLNIYDLRQEVIEIRENSELIGEFNNYKYPFNPNKWKCSNLCCPKRGEYKGYHINVEESMLETVRNFVRLEELNE